MPRITVGTVVRILILCFIVGLALAFFGVDPLTLWRDLAGWARDSVAWLFDNLGAAFSYVVLGAIIVVPIWAIVFLFKVLGSRR